MSRVRIALALAALGGLMALSPRPVYLTAGEPGTALKPADHVRSSPTLTSPTVGAGGGAGSMVSFYCIDPSPSGAIERCNRTTLTSTPTTTIPITTVHTGK